MTALELRARLDDLVLRWRVTVERARETETALLAFGSRDDQPVVLKVLKHEGEEWRSGEVLRALAGRGVVQVYEQMDGAVLLERAIPGTSLAGLAMDGKDDQATEILGTVIRETARTAPPKSCATVGDWASSFARYLASGGGPLPTPLVEEAHAVYIDLAASQREPMLLHGDLHHYNVLYDKRRGWLAIDPKGVVGEIEYEIGALLRNPVELPELFTSRTVIERRLRTLERTLNLDGERALRWAFAQAVLAAVWNIEDGVALDANNPFIMLATALRDTLH